jgi:hypothetical protein
MPTATMVTLPSRTSPICCLGCAFLCILTHSDVDNTERQKGTLCADCKKWATLFLDCFVAVREHKQYWNKWIAADGWINIINDRYNIPTSLKFVAAADLNRAIGGHPKFSSSIDTIGNTNVHGLYKATCFEHGGKRKSRLTTYTMLLVRIPCLRSQEVIQNGKETWLVEYQSQRTQGRTPQ